MPRGPALVESPCSIEGTSWAIVTPLVSINRSSWRMSRVCSAVAIATAAPLTSGSHSSHPAASKLGDVLARTTSVPWMPVAALRDSNWLTTPACGTVTPLGLPVEPEV
jgi:hypothetical protein